MDVPSTVLKSSENSGVNPKVLGNGRRLLAFGLVLLVLAHNLLFQYGLLPFIRPSTLSTSFSIIQLLRNLIELGLVVIVLQIIGLSWRSYRQQSWGSLPALRAISCVLVLMNLTSYLIQLASPLDLTLPTPVAPTLTLSLESLSWPWILLNSVFLTPIREELFFRGLLWTLIASKRGSRQATVISALLFSLAHLPSFEVAELVQQLIFGFMLGYLVPRYGLGICIAVHMSVNLWALALHPSTASLRLWLLQDKWLSFSLSLLLLGLFFRGLLDAVQSFWTRRSKTNA